MNELINIAYNSDKPTVSARELHKALEVAHRFNDWMNTNKTMFVENQDYTTVPVLVEVKNNGGTQQRQLNDYQLTVETAKNICMMSRTEKGKQIRQYFISVENDWNSPDKVMARALTIANKTLDELKGENKKLLADNSALTVDKQIMQPKAEYFDELVDRNLLTNFRDTAKELHIGPKALVTFLLEHKYLYRDKSGNLKPYQDKNKSLFEVKETVNEKTNWRGTQTLVTPKGRETFRLLMVVDKKSA